MKKTILKKYAELIVRSGLALRKGQPVIITANLDQEDFVSLVVEECYKAGASHVYLDWKSEKVARITNKKGKLKDLKQVLPMELAYQQWFTDALPARLWIDSDDPDAAKGLDAAKMAEIKKPTMRFVLLSSKPARTNINGASPAPLPRHGPKRFSQTYHPNRLTRSFGKPFLPPLVP